MTTPQRPLFLARLSGTQAEMGAQHGRMAAADAHRLLAFYRTMPERTLAGGIRATFMTQRARTKDAMT